MSMLCASRRGTEGRPERRPQPAARGACPLAAVMLNLIGALAGDTGEARRPCFRRFGGMFMYPPSSREHLTLLGRKGTEVGLT